jgi:signal transduction histidine kinase
MIDLLGRSGQLDDAVTTAEKMPFQPDLPLWSTMLGACQKLGNVNIGIQAYNFAHTVDETHYASFISISNIYAVAKVVENGCVAKNLKSPLCKQAKAQ